MNPANQSTAGIGVRPSARPPFLLVTGDFVTTGGMDRANHALADYLARRGDEVHLVAHRVSEDLLAYPNVVFHQVLRPANSHLLGAALLDRAGRRWATKIVARRGRVLVNGGNCQWPDINWVHYVHAAYAPHGAAIGMRGIKSRVAHRVWLFGERRALNKANVVLANSLRTKSDLTNRLGLDGDRVHVIRYGVDPTLFHPVTSLQRAELRRQLNWHETTPTVAFVGGLGDRRKGLGVLIEAWAHLARVPGWDADLVVIGTGSDLPAWKRRIESLELQTRVRFLGFRTDVSTLLKACDALVAPTMYEAFGLGVHEALCCGIPAIVSRNAGVAECYPPSLQSLQIDNPTDHRDVVRCLQAWQADFHRLSAEARSVSSILRLRTWDRMAEDIVRVTESV